MKLASIEIIRSIKKHPNADTLDLMQVLGWQVVAKSGIHQQGDKIVFIPIDTVLPKENWSSSFVDKNNPDKPIRLKMIKLRGEHSSGVVLPLSLFPPFTDLEEGTDRITTNHPTTTRTPAIKNAAPGKYILALVDVKCANKHHLLKQLWNNIVVDYRRFYSIRDLEVHKELYWSIYPP
jgi:hypothetical protein